MSKLPKSWNDVSLKQLIEIEAIRNDKSIDNELYPDLTRSLLILSLFTGVPFEHYENKPINDLHKELNKLKFLTELPKAEFIKSFYHKGYKWKVEFDLKQLSAQQFINHYELTKDSTKVFENAHKLMAIYCSPKRLWIKTKMTDERKQELMMNCPISVVYPLTLFFCNLYPILFEGIKDYLNHASQFLNQTWEKVENLNQQAT
jgi:hypothetical protein